MGVYRSPILGTCILSLLCVVSGASHGGPKPGTDLLLVPPLSMVNSFPNGTRTKLIVKGNVMAPYNSVDGGVIGDSTSKATCEISVTESMRCGASLDFSVTPLEFPYPYQLQDVIQLSPGNSLGTSPLLHAGQKHIFTIAFSEAHFRAYVTSNIHVFAHHPPRWLRFGVVFHCFPSEHSTPYKPLKVVLNKQFHALPHSGRFGRHHTALVIALWFVAVIVCNLFLIYVLLKQAGGEGPPSGHYNTNHTRGRMLRHSDDEDDDEHTSLINHVS